MNKVFLYLYPIKEFVGQFILYGYTDDDKLDYYEQYQRREPLEVLNEAIDKRYRQNGYKIVYATYPDKEIYGIDLKDTDKIIKTDINFSEVKNEFKYPNEDYLINQFGEIDELVVGGYHAFDCVLKVTERALERGINAQIDIELTDIFFGIYYEDYFEIDNYDKYRYKSYRKALASMLGMEDTFEDEFNEMYSSEAFGYDKTNTLKK